MMSCNHYFTNCYVCGFVVDIPFHTEEECKRKREQFWKMCAPQSTTGTPVWPQQGFSRWLDGSYNSEEDEDDWPPVHPNCRCELEPEKPVEECKSIREAREIIERGLTP